MLGIRRKCHWSDVVARQVCIYIYMRKCGCNYMRKHGGWKGGVIQMHAIWDVCASIKPFAFEKTDAAAAASIIIG